MKVNHSDSWPREPSEAIVLQKKLATAVEIRPFDREINIVAACDVAFIGKARQQKKLIAGVIVYDMSKREIIEKHSVIRDVNFPYIPGLLSFREAPAVIDAITFIKSEVDVFLIDGQGIAHPRRFGLASHIGVIINKPTIGCAKSRLCGRQASQLGIEKGARVDLIDGKEVIGVVLRTREAVKPVYVSVGNKITLEQAVETVLKCTTKYRLPDPARFVHNYVTLRTREFKDISKENNGK